VTGSGQRTTQSGLTDERRSAIIALLSTMNDGLPEPPSLRTHSTAGFVNEPRARTCPDCMAHPKWPSRAASFGCETCKGSGEVPATRLDDIALPDGLPGDGDSRDPYEVNNTTTAFKETTKLGHVPGRDAEIDRALALAKDRPVSEVEAAGEATPYVWERERATMFRRYDYAALQRALELLRDRSPQLAAAVVSVHTHRLVEPSATLEAAVEHGLRFISLLMPATIRAPGMENKHPALARRDKRRQAAA
jgi:hypothetical protein